MYRKNVENVRIHKIRFNDYARMIHTVYRGISEGKDVGWSEQEKIHTEKEWFARKLKGK